MIQQSALKLLLRPKAGLWQDLRQFARIHSGFSIVIKHVPTDDGALIRTFDVVLSQTFGSGEIALSVDKNNLTTTEFPTIPTTLPVDTVYSGLTAGYTFAPGETSKTFRVIVNCLQA